MPLRWSPLDLCNPVSAKDVQEEHMLDESQNPNYAADEETSQAHPETQPCKQPKFTPTTLKNAVAQEATSCPPISVQPVKKRNMHLKGAKMNTKANTSATTRANGRPPVKKKAPKKSLAYEQCADNPKAPVYIPGQRMLRDKAYEQLRLEMKILHDKIVELELANNKQGSIVNPTHYIAKVPKGYTFFEKFSGDKIYKDYKEIFYMFRFYSIETCLWGYGRFFKPLR